MNKLGGLEYSMLHCKFQCHWLFFLAIDIIRINWLVPIFPYRLPVKANKQQCGLGLNEVCGPGVSAIRIVSPSKSKIRQWILFLIVNQPYISLCIQICWTGIVALHVLNSHISDSCRCIWWFLYNLSLQSFPMSMFWKMVDFPTFCHKHYSNIILWINEILFLVENMITLLHLHLWLFNL